MGGGDSKTSCGADIRSFVRHGARSIYMGALIVNEITISAAGSAHRTPDAPYSVTKTHTHTYTSTRVSADVGLGTGLWRVVCF